MSTPSATRSPLGTPASRRYYGSTPAQSSAMSRRGRRLWVLLALVALVLLCVIIIPPAVVLTRDSKNNAAQQNAVVTVVNGETRTIGQVNTRTSLTTLADGEVSTILSVITVPAVTVSATEAPQSVATEYVTSTLSNGVEVILATVTDLVTDVATYTFTQTNGEVQVATLTVTSFDIVTVVACAPFTLCELLKQPAEYLLPQGPDGNVLVVRLDEHDHRYSQQHSVVLRRHPQHVDARQPKFNVVAPFGDLHPFPLKHNYELVSRVLHRVFEPRDVDKRVQLSRAQQRRLTLAVVFCQLFGHHERAGAGLGHVERAGEPKLVQSELAERLHSAYRGWRFFLGRVFQVQLVDRRQWWPSYLEFRLDYLAARQQLNWRLFVAVSTYDHEQFRGGSSSSGNASSTSVTATSTSEITSPPASSPTNSNGGGNSGPSTSESSAGTSGGVSVPPVGSTGYSHSSPALSTRIDPVAIPTQWRHPFLVFRRVVCPALLVCPVLLDPVGDDHFSSGI
ncbi:hypothetical protein JCM10213_001181 [Rhodosporidiobolus nylandii]